jgi:phosphohistidine phosphatase SixA
MTRRLHALALAALIAAPAAAAGCASAPSPSPSAQGATTVVVVRHAERATTNPQDRDPGLSPAGEQRARELARLLRDRRVGAVVTSQFARTRLTGAPTAEAAGVAVDSVAVGRDLQAHVAAVADLVRTRHAGKTVLVVGHSNTVTKIVAALGGPPMADLCESAYGNLFTLVIPVEGQPRLTRGTYGAADPTATPGCTDGFVAPRPAAPQP